MEDGVMDPHALPDLAAFPRRCTTTGVVGTRALGAALAGVLAPGDAVFLYGPLGAGKTCLVQGLCEALAVEDEVISPTFTLVNCYRGRTTVHHLDLYRIEADDDLQDIGVDEILDELDDGRTLLLVEWPRLLEPLLTSRLDLLGLPGDDPETRIWYARGVPDVTALFPETNPSC